MERNLDEIAEEIKKKIIDEKIEEINGILVEQCIKNNAALKEGKYCGLQIDNPQRRVKCIYCEIVYCNYEKLKREENENKTQ